MYSNILLEEAPLDSSYREDLKLVVEQAERCKRIVAGLLNFARKNQVNHSEIDINELIRKSISSVIIPENIQLKINSALKNPFAEIDEEQMVQAISNLIRNAVEAMPLGGKIEVSLDDNQREIKIEIRDSGTGINEVELQKVFEPFYTTKGIGKGTGLGLPTAYGVIKMHRGSIEVSSNANPVNGPTYTTFNIQLPRRSPI
jgi:signal transduction histidine kinase